MTNWQLQCGEARNALDRIYGVLRRGLEPRRSEVEQTVCINQALNIATAALEAIVTTPVEDEQKGGK